MIPFRISAAAREANSSPSIALERGGYRMRAPSTRRQNGTSHPTGQPRQHDRPASTHITILIVLLTAACITSFGAAYYLFSTRWDARSVHHVRSLRTDQNLEAVAVDNQSTLGGHSGWDSQEKYLSYLPHSGFHNQRIAFENALVLSRLLNRTLLVPPVRLGNKPIRYVKFETLRQFLGLSGKEGLRHCAKISEHAFLPPECSDYFDFTHIPWGWLVDLTEVSVRQKLLARWNMTGEWIWESLKISQADTFTLRDSNPYHYRFHDTPTKASSSKYMESIDIGHLAHSPKRLIELGTLFGSSRLYLNDKNSILVRREIRKSMTFANSRLVHAADTIGKSLGGSYMGAHIRIGDSQFKANAQLNSRLIWWTVVHEFLGFSSYETLALENSIRDQEVDAPVLQVPRLSPDLAALRVPHPPPPSLPTKTSFRLACRGVKHTSTDLKFLNTPLFISTDARDPLSEPAMRRFLRTFPCTFFLSDFMSNVESLGALWNEDDGLLLKDFLLPFLDAMVVGKAWQVVGTEGSTFSRFVQDVLWRSYHGWNIVQRG